MTNKEFQRLVDMAISRGGLKEVGLDKVYVMLTWWKDEFRPLVSIDGDWSTGEKICVFGSDDQKCNKWHDGLPCAFWISSKSVRFESAVHRPYSVDILLSLINGSNPEAPTKFLICGSPKNMFVEINPFKTRILRNWGEETMLCLYVENRFGCEVVPFEKMTENRIEVIDVHLHFGKYKYGEWREDTKEAYTKEEDHNIIPESDANACDVKAEKEPSVPSQPV